MLLDRRVNRRKFELEVERVREHEELLQQWSCALRAVDFPHIDLEYDLRHCLQPLGVILPPASVGQLMEQMTRQTAILRGAGFGVRFSLDDYDQRPPAVTFCDRATWKPLLSKDMLTAAFVPNPNANGAMVNVLVADHITTERPFLCIRGTREYHEHPQHSGDDWQLYRASIGVFTLIRRISEACIQHSRPFVMSAGEDKYGLVWLAV